MCHIALDIPVLAARVEKVHVGSVNLCRTRRIGLVVNDGAIWTESRNGLERETHKVRLLSAAEHNHELSSATMQVQAAKIATLRERERERESMCMCKPAKLAKPLGGNALIERAHDVRITHSTLEPTEKLADGRRITNVTRAHARELRRILDCLGHDNRRCLFDCSCHNET